MQPVRERHPSSFPILFCLSSRPHPRSRPVAALVSVPIVPSFARLHASSRSRSVPVPITIQVSVPAPTLILPPIPIAPSSPSDPVSPSVQCSCTSTSGLAKRAVGCPQAPLPVCCRDYDACGMKESAAKPNIIAAADVLLPSLRQMLGHVGVHLEPILSRGSLS